MHLIYIYRSIDQESRDYIYQNQPIYNVRRDPIFVEASFNWWGFNEVVPVSGRIKVTKKAVTESFITISTVYEGLEHEHKHFNC